MQYKKTDHPWGRFLDARADAIDWMRSEQKYSDKEIAWNLSMDEEQVHKIRTRARNLDIAANSDLLY